MTDFGMNSYFVTNNATTTSPTLEELRASLEQLKQLTERMNWEAVGLEVESVRSDRVVAKLHRPTVELRKNLVIQLDKLLDLPGDRCYRFNNPYTPDTTMLICGTKAFAWLTSGLKEPL